MVQVAATRAGLTGGQRLRTNHSDQAFARILKHWYARQGDFLQSVTGATIDADSAVAKILVEEPCISPAGYGSGRRNWSSSHIMSILRKTFDATNVWIMLLPRRFAYFPVDLLFGCLER